MIYVSVIKFTSFSPKPFLWCTTKICQVHVTQYIYCMYTLSVSRSLGELVFRQIQFGTLKTICVFLQIIAQIWGDGKISL